MIIKKYSQFNQQKLVHIEQEDLTCKKEKIKCNETIIKND